MKMKPVYVAATGQHAGKTTVAVGLLHGFQQRGLRPGFIKPVGQRYMQIEDLKVDEDAVLVRDAFKTSTALRDMSPVAVPRGFTESYIRSRNPNELRRSILEAFGNVSAEADVVVVEGTGHAGVGSVFDFSNAQVAALLGAPVIIVSEGGIGRPIDELCLNRALFSELGVPMLGAVLNKVLPEKYDHIVEIAHMGMKALNVPFLGALPFVPRLSFPTVRQVADALGARVIAGGEHLHNVIEHTVIAAMEPQNVIGYLREKTLVITPGDRIDNILVAISSHFIGSDTGPHISGIILTGGLMPHHTILSLLKRSDIPVLMSEEQTFDVSNHVTDVVFKITPDDVEKIAQVRELVWKHLDFDYILNALST